MKDRGGDRLAAFPFSFGCVSHSAVSAVDPHRKRPPSDPSTAQRAEVSGAAAAAPGIVAAGVQRLIKGFRSLSQLFAAYDEEEEEEEREMAIGYPTDVQHVGHIGWDGFSKGGGMGMGVASAFTLKQLEMAMEARAARP